MTSRSTTPANTTNALSPAPFPPTGPDAPARYETGKGCLMLGGLFLALIALTLITILFFLEGPPTPPS